MNISEIFYSLQGEGILTGVPSVFIRVSGCNLRCAWCDTQYASWHPEIESMSLDAILQEVESYPCNHVVISGGEPTLQPELIELTTRLKALGKHITMESNGTTYREGLVCDLLSLSPKLSHSISDPQTFPVESAMQSTRRIQIEALQSWIDQYNYQLKFVVMSAKDIQEIQTLLKQLARPVPAERVLLMPEGVDSKTLLKRSPEIIAACKQFGYRYCTRLHIDLFGNTRGT